MMEAMPSVVVAALLLLVATAAVTDLKSRRIPNLLTGAGILAGFTLNAILFGWAGLRFAGLGMAVGFGLYFALYCIRAMGAGDVKLMAAIGALAGKDHWLVIFLAASVIGGLAAVLLAMRKHRLGSVLWNVGFIISELAQFRAPFRKNSSLDVRSPGALTLPHAVSIAAGTLIALVWISLRG